MKFVTSILVLALVALFVSGNDAKPAAQEFRYCDGCRDIISFSKRLSEDFDQQGLENAFVKWCRTGRGASIRVCAYLAKDLFSFLGKVDTDGFCERIRVCPLEMPYDLPRLPFAASNSTTCDFCVNTLGHIKEILSSKQTENELKQTLAQGCNHLGGFEDECVKLLDQNLDELFEYLRTELQPNEFCQELGACSSEFVSPDVKVLELSEVINVYPAGIDGDADKMPYATFEGTDIMIEAPSPSKTVNGPDCLICKKVIAWLYTELKDNATKDEIVNVLDKVCDEIFKPPNQQKCETFVSQYTDELVDIITQQTDPELACAILGYCNTKVSEVEMVNPPKENVKLKSPLCLMCKKMFNYVYSQLSDNSSREDIENCLASSCALCPKKDDCEKYIKDNADKLINLIISKTEPEDACEMLWVCAEVKEVVPFTKVEVTAIKTEPKEKIQGQICDICKQIFSWLHAQITGNDTKETVIGYLDQVCEKILPQQDQSQCKQFVKEYTDRILNVLSAQTSPDTACALLHACTFNKDQNRIQVIKIEQDEGPEVDLVYLDHDDRTNEIGSKNKNLSKSTPRETLCYECQTVMHFIQEKLYDYKTEEEIDEYIEKYLCDSLGSTIEKDTCNSFIKEYGASIIQLVALKVFDPTVVCEQELHICPNIHHTPTVEDNSRPLTNPNLDFELVGTKLEETCNTCIKIVDRLDAILKSEAAERDLSKLATQICHLITPQGIKRERCEGIIATYGPYFLEMIGELNNARQLCKSVDLCYIKGEVHLLGGHKCTFGPSYWCHTSAHAESCKATEYCKMKVWKSIQ